MIETSKLPESDNKLSKRATQLFSVAAVPATMISAIGDFLGPIGGWKIVGGLGVLAIIFAVYMLMALSLSDGKKRPFWYKVTSDDEELNWIWTSKPVIFSHGIHVVAVFGIVCLFFAGKTLASLDSGGFLGKEIDAVAAAQKQLGLTQALVEGQKKTNEELSSLNTKATNFKKEVSDDPRKELVNLGQAWSSDGFLKAIGQSDARSVKLYLAGGMPIRAEDIVGAFMRARASKEILLALAEYPSQFDSAGCPSLLDRLPAEAIATSTEEGRSLVVKLCKGPAHNAYAQRLKIQATDRFDAEKKRREQVERDRKSPQVCFTEEFGKNGEKILAEASSYSLIKMIDKDFIGPREKMIADLSVAMSTMTLADNGAKIVRTYCEEKSKAGGSAPIDSRELDKWTTIVRWLS